MFWFTAFWRTLFDRDQDRWATFGSLETRQTSKAPSTIAEAWGRNFGALLNALIAADESSKPAAAPEKPLSADEQKQRDEEQRNYKRRHLSPWSAASWYTVYMHLFVENRRLQRMSSIQSPPAIAQFNPNAPAKVGVAKTKLAEWSG